MRTLSLWEQVAQMVIPRIDGPSLDNPIERARLQALVRKGIGGFILFGGDIEHTPRHLRELQAIAEVPLLIASDVERGLGQQLAGGTRFPSQRAVASAINRRSKKDAALLDRMLDAIRRETRAAGIHAVFSPVMDVNNNPANPIICTRAFGDEPGIVEWFGARYIRALQKSSGKDRVDLLACAKHFPGHGDTDQDSHTVLPVIHAERSRLNRIELPPFRESVKNNVGMVMVAHLLVPALDPDKPTTFSKKTITALLREGMEFEGLIVSDALDMGALANEYSQEEIAIRAVEAGMDILLHPRDARQTIDAVVAAVQEGRVTTGRIQESVDRILAAKKRLGLFDREHLAQDAVDYEQHQLIAREIGRKVFSLVRGQKSFLPLDADAGVACFILDDDNNHESGNVFISAMRDRFSNFSLIVLTPDAEKPECLVNESIQAAGYVVMAVYSRISASKGSSGISDRLKSMISDILGTAKAASTKTLAISFDSPYILDLFSEADVCIAAYDSMKEIQTAAAELLAEGVTTERQTK